ncbi:TPA_asm: hypothetical protein vir519_00003 [Caudoviricetes sp. vir519]|nr:TPA_asm: hypothetical protein vir519_00003 [Caudoviricetes sp. vir519]
MIELSKKEVEHLIELRRKHIASRSREEKEEIVAEATRDLIKKGMSVSAAILFFQILPNKYPGGYDSKEPFLKIQLPND